MKTEKMRAVRIVGGMSGESVEALEVGEVERPEAVGDRVRVRAYAAALNRADLLQRRGRYPAPPGAPADIPGLEFAGEVEQMGGEVRAWQIGQRVFGITAGGAQAEYVVVPESAVAEIPPNLGWAEAAAIPEVFITAHDALFTQANFTLGERVLVHAAGSGVGTAAIQLARAAGAGAIYGTARTPEKLEQARSYGLDEGVVISSGGAQSFAEAVREWTGGAGVHVIIDLVGSPYLAANLEALASRGRLMLIGTVGGASAPLNFSTVMRKRLTITGTALRTRSAAEKAYAVKSFATHVGPLLARGMVRPVIDKIYPMNEVREAHERLESNASFGKVVLLMTNDT